MAKEALAARNPDQIHTDVLSSSRQACYKARDAFYTCLEKESDKKQTEIASKGLLYPAQCKAARDEFVNNCRASWVKHFDALHCKSRSLKRLLDDKDSRRGWNPHGVAFIHFGRGIRLHLAPLGGRNHPGQLLGAC